VPGCWRHESFCDVAVSGRVVVACVNDDGRRLGECLARQLAYPRLGNGEDYDIFGVSNLLHRRGRDASLGGQPRQRGRAARVRDEDSMPERRKATGEQTADVAGPNES
jgi:hypothetical protein